MYSCIASENCQTYTKLAAMRLPRTVALLHLRRWLPESTFGDEI